MIKVDGNEVLCEGRSVVTWRFLGECLNDGTALWGSKGGALLMEDFSVKRRNIGTIGRSPHKKY